MVFITAARYICYICKFIFSSSVTTVSSIAAAVSKSLALFATGTSILRSKITYFLAFTALVKIS